MERVVERGPRNTNAISAQDAIGRVWYGGVLDPVTVESKSTGAHAAATTDRVLSRPTVRCVQASHFGFRAVT